MGRMTLTILTFIQHGKQKYWLSFIVLLSYLKLWNKQGNGSSTTAYRQKLGTQEGHLETRKILYRVQHGNFTVLQIVVVLLSSFQFFLFFLYLSLCYLNTYTKAWYLPPKETFNHRLWIVGVFFSIYIPAQPEAAITPYKLFYNMDHVFLLYIMLSALNKLS